MESNTLRLRTAERGTVARTSGQPHAWGLGALVMVSLLAACGGSSGGGSNNGPPPSNLAYPSESVVLESGEVLTPLVPTVTGNVTSWSIDPALPAGLDFDGSTGIISGTATADALQTVHTVRAVNAGGSAFADIDLRVLGIPRYLVIANLNDSTLSRLTYEDGEALPLQHAGYHRFSGSAEGPQAIVLHPNGLFLFAVHALTNTVSTQVVDPATGAISTATPQPAGSGPHFMALTEDGTFLYVAARGSNQVHAFSIDETTGALNPEGSVESIPAELSQLLVDPDGEFLLSLHRLTGTIQAYPIDGGTGVPTLGTALTLPALTQPMHGTLHPSGEHLYVGLNFGMIARFPITSSDGELGVAQTRQVGDTPTWLAIHPEASFLYVVREANEDIRRFTIDAGTGVLTFDEDGGEAPQGARLFIDERGTRAHVIDVTGGTLAAYDLDASTGDLALLQTLRTRPGPRSCVLLRGSSTLDRRGEQLYVVNSGSDTVRTFDVEASGELSLNATDAPTGSTPIDIALDPRQRFAFVLNATEIRTFDIESDGSLSDSGFFVLTGPNPNAITVDTTGRFLYLIDRDDDIVTLYAIGADGELTIDAGLPISTGVLPRSLAVEPTGKFLFVGHDGSVPNGTEGAITPHLIDPEDGTLTVSGAVGPGPGFPSSITFARSAMLLYATLLVANTTAPYPIDPVTGQPTPTPPGSPVPAGDEPFDLAFTPDGRFAFVAVRNPGDVGQVLAYDVRPTDGAVRNEGDNNFQPKQTFDLGLLRPRRLAVSHDGQHLYVLSEGSDQVHVLAIDAGGLLATDGFVATCVLPWDMELRIVLD